MRNPAVKRGRIAARVLAIAIPFASALTSAEEVLYYESRADIPEKYTWDLSLYYKDAEAWDQAFAELEAMLPKMEQYRGKVGDSPESMAAALEYMFEISSKLGPLYVNAHQKVHLLRTDEVGADQSGRIVSLNARVGEATAFVEPEIAGLEEKKIAKFRKARALEPYRHYLDNIWRLRAHSRSPEVEEVVAGSSLAGGGHRRAYDELNYADITWPTVVDENGEEVVVSPGQFGRLRASSDRDVRKRGWEAHMGKIAEYNNTYAATYGSKIQRDVWLAQVYRFPSSIDAALSVIDVPPEVMDTLVGTVRDNVDKIQGHNELRRQILGYEELHPWDSQVSLLPDGGRKYSFDEGWELAMLFWRETFGDEFADIAQQALDQRWVDVYSNEGKEGGAYSWGTYRQASYLMLNWQGELDDVSTLVHEMGHSVHRVLAGQNQSYHDASTDIFVAEVGSVASESLFAEWMLERTQDPDERKQLLNNALNGIRGTFVTQVFFHEWEAEVHALAEDGQALTADVMNQTYQNLLTAYEGDSVQPHELSKVGWSRISHFFRNFYVWKYASSYAAGEALAARFRSGDKSAADDYIKMLKLGGSVYPMDVLKAGGVDMTDPSVIRAVMDRYGLLQEQLAKEFGL